MPIEAAVEGRVQLARSLEISRPLQNLLLSMRILPKDAAQPEFGEGFDLGGL